MCASSVFLDISYLEIRPSKLAGVVTIRVSRATLEAKIGAACSCTGAIGNTNYVCPEEQTFCVRATVRRIGENVLTQMILGYRQLPVNPADAEAKIFNAANVDTEWKQLTFQGAAKKCDGFAVSSLSVFVCGKTTLYKVTLHIV